MSPLEFVVPPPPEPALHVVLVVGTRPEAIKLAPVALALRARPEARVSIWCTGQHADWAIEMLACFRLVPDRVLDLPHRPPGLAPLFGGMLALLHEALGEERPDLVLVQGDTSSAFAGALAASYACIPVVHVEAGLRSGDRRLPFPEEAHRRAIANFATLHCTPTRQATDILLAEGVDAADILQSGNTVIDALRLIERRLPDAAAAPDAVRSRILLTCHRRESWGEPYRAVCAAARRLAARGDCEIAFVVHPNPELTRVAHDMLGELAGIRLMPPQNYVAFLHLLRQANLVLTDSGGVQEEAAALGTPLLVLRDSTERPEGLASGTARLVGTEETAIVAEVGALLDRPAALAAMRIPCTLYGDGHAAARIAEAILRRWRASPVPSALPGMLQISAAAEAIGSMALA